MSIAANPRVVTVAGKQFRATLDKQSLELLTALCRKEQERCTPLLAGLIARVHSDRALAAKVARFSSDFEDREPKEHGKLFGPWGPKVHEELNRLSWEIIGTGNKAKVIRVLIAFFAKEFRLRPVETRLVRCRHL